jgi:hypothetical protein
VAKPSKLAPSSAKLDLDLPVDRRAEVVAALLRLLPEREQSGGREIGVAAAATLVDNLDYLDAEGVAQLVEYLHETATKETNARRSERVRAAALYLRCCR